MNPTPDSVTTATRRFGTGTITRIVAGGIAAGSMIGRFAAVAPANAADEPHKSYVCKYVDKPGEDERLQTGQNPIWVDNHSLLGYDGTVTVGQSFKDAQGRSVVIVANTPKLDPEPSIEDCPAPTPPTTTTTTPTSSTTTPTETHTTATLIPTTPPATTTYTLITPTETHTTATLISPTTETTTTTPSPAASVYPLQPVKAGATTNGTSREVVVTPLRAALVLLALFGLWVAFGGRLPHVRRVGSGRDRS